MSWSGTEHGVRWLSDDLGEVKPNDTWFRHRRQADEFVERFYQANLGTVLGRGTRFAFYGDERWYE